MDNETLPKQPPAVTPTRRNTARRWLGIVVASALSGALVMVGVPYLSG